MDREINLATLNSVLQQEREKFTSTQNQLDKAQKEVEQNVIHLRELNEIKENLVGDHFCVV